MEVYVSSIPSQVVADIRGRLESGTLTPGDRLPSTRALAEQLGVSRGSIVTAYEQLAGEGILVASSGGSRIHPALPIPAFPPRHTVTAVCPAPPLEMLRPGAALTEALTTSTWRAAWRAAAAEPHAYASPGSPRLRHLLAEHIRLARAMPLGPESIIITGGARDGLRALLAALSASGVAPRLGVEDPGFPSLHTVPHAVGWEVETMPFDDDGPVPPPAVLPGHSAESSPVAARSPSAVLITPNHQFPYGTQMPAGRRRQWVEWRQSMPGALLIEDDYDSELRATHPALLALDPGGTVLLGSLAKILTPALGLGYLVVPERLRDAVAAHVTPVSGIGQDALAHFLEADGLRRHTARVRREYKYRRSVFESIFPEGNAMEGGLGATIELSPTAESDVLHRARNHGLAVESLAKYWSAAENSGIVVGLGTGSREKLTVALTTLRGLIPQPTRT
ncbi:PLP-dependent aminotransferase family protein [Trueperella pecoris]|nr:PLP-dependent aminotransferase family protein [Trueperella pecoris]